MGMPPGSIRRSANLVLLFLVIILALGGMLIAASLLGPFLLAFALVFMFLAAVYFTGGLGMTGWQIIAGILIFFAVGFGIHTVMGSVIGYDPVQTGYTSTLATVKLGTVGYSLSDSDFSMWLGFGAIFAVVLLAFVGLFYSQMHRRR